MVNFSACQQLCGQQRHLQSRQPMETYYDILQVPLHSSKKEIHAAFVKLSKQFHPDVKGVTHDPVQTARFVKISEAYQTLSRPKLRSVYDQKLWARGIRPVIKRAAPDIKPKEAAFHTSEIHKQWQSIRPTYQTHPNPTPYYGVKGVNKVSNLKIALALIGLGMFGAIFGFVSVRHSFTFNRQKLDERSAEAASAHAAIRANVETLGNEEQLRRMIDRMTGGQGER